MKQIYDALPQITARCGNFTVAINIINNQVDITLEDEKNLSQFIDFLKEVNLYQKNAINFIIAPYTEINELSAKAYGGDKTSDWSSLISRGSMH